MTGWVALLGAGMLEIIWALGLKHSDGLTRFWPTAMTLLAIALSFSLMAVALKSLPFGTAYAVWTGIGAAGSIDNRDADLWRASRYYPCSLSHHDRRRHYRAET